MQNSWFFYHVKEFFIITFSFTKKPKKYALIKNEQNPERMLKHQKKLLKKFDLEECAKSNLPDDLKTFMETVVSWQNVVRVVEIIFKN